MTIYTDFSTVYSGLQAAQSNMQNVIETVYWDLGFGKAGHYRTSARCASFTLCSSAYCNVLIVSNTGSRAEGEVCRQTGTPGQLPLLAG